MHNDEKKKRLTVYRGLLEYVNLLPAELGKEHGDEHADEVVYLEQRVQHHAGTQHAHQDPTDHLNLFEF